MVIENGWLICLCYVQTKALKELGVDDSEWVDCALEVSAIKGFLDSGDGKVVISCLGIDWSIQATFEEVKALLLQPS